MEFILLDGQHPERRAEKEPSPECHETAKASQAVGVQSEETNLRVERKHGSEYDAHCEADTYGSDADAAAFGGDER